jgi:serine/threonine-protein kinase
MTQSHVSTITSSRRPPRDQRRHAKLATVKLGPVVRRTCGRCGLVIEGDTADRDCPKCRVSLIEIRGEHDPFIGQVVDGRYEIRAKLGAGGMGTIYRAYQGSVRREVAIKLMAPAFAADAMAVTRFEREAQLASKLSQPNTVSVFDFGRTPDGQLYIAMELIAGKTLRELVRAGGAFTIARALHVGAQLCDALEAAHGLGIIHRDLKLENIIVLDDPPGRDLIKVLDFGLAKQIDDPNATGAGFVVGTPRYIAPEVALEAKLSPAGDLYAVGVILAELVNGRPLWDGADLGELFRLKLSPRDATATLPAGIRGLVDALLDPSPARRPTAAQTRAWLTRPDLDQLHDAPTEVATPAARALTPPPSQPLGEAPTVAGPTPPGSPPVQARHGLAYAALALGFLAVIAVIIALTRRDGAAPATAATGSPAPSAAPPAPPAAAASGAVARPADAAPPAPPVDAAGPDAAAVNTGPAAILHITTTPPGLKIKIAGREVGVSPIDVPLPTGPNPVWVDAYPTAGAMLAKQVIVDGERDVGFDVEAKLKWDTDRAPPATGDTVTVTVVTLPPGAVVRMHDKDLGRSPHKLVLPRGSQEMMVSAAWDFTDQTAWLTPSRDQEIVIDLAPRCVDELVNLDSVPCLRRYCEGHPEDRHCPQPAAHP